MNSGLQSVVLIGTAYSGSTALGMALNSTKNNLRYVGELSRAPGLYEKYQLDLRVGTCSACQISNQTCKVFSETLFKKIQEKSPSEVHRYLIRQLKTKTIVDSSKHPAWLRLLAEETPAYKIKVVITVKNPKYYIQSCLDRGLDSAWIAANAWRDTYFDSLRTLNRLGVSYYVVRNEDFINNRAEVITNLEHFLGIKYRLQHQSNTIHAIGGNPAARIEEVGGKKIRESAKRLGQKVFDLNPFKSTPTSQQKITYNTQILFDTPGLSDIANLFGYNVADLV